MTLFASVIDNDQISIVMDTLVHNPENFCPTEFSRKFKVIKNKFCIAGTGSQYFINCLYYLIDTELKPNENDFSILDLSESISKFIFYIQKTEPCEHPTTIYLFGFDNDGFPRGYRYLLKNSFQLENILSECLIYRPDHKLGKNYSLPISKDDLFDIALRIYNADRSLPKEKRAHIGGELEYISIDKNCINIETLHQFDSYEKEKEYILQNNR